MTSTQQGFLLIADISGYTRYLSTSELEHAQGILTTLLELLIEHTRPPLQVYRLEGDAVVSYSLAGVELQGQTFVEMVENTYVAFRRAIDLMVLNNTCQCSACANVSSLDLKFFVHRATFAIQRLGDRQELVGSDVNLIHRLLKNHVVEQTGIRAYTLYTDVAIRKLGLAEAQAGMTEHRESYEHLGEVVVWVEDMHPVWEARKESLRITIPPDKVSLHVETVIDLPVELVWDYLAQPDFRRVLIGSDRQVVLDRKNGRIAEGSKYQCYHGDVIIMQTVVQWRPFEQMTTEDLVPIPGSSIRILMDYRLEPEPVGTKLVQEWGPVKGNIFGRSMTRMILPTKRKEAQADIEKFKAVIEAETARQSERRLETTHIPPDEITRAVAASLDLE
ncbi:MAG: DUF2652 domain-containing protein [Caldilineales bacterium]|nr:DUF2652 domain-containing protein [Caldilineales bacterium]